MTPGCAALRWDLAAPGAANFHGAQLCAVEWGTLPRPRQEGATRYAAAPAPAASLATAGVEARTRHDKAVLSPRLGSGLLRWLERSKAQGEVIQSVIDLSFQPRGEVGRLAPTLSDTCGCAVNVVVEYVLRPARLDAARKVHGAMRAWTGAAGDILIGEDFLDRDIKGEAHRRGTAVRHRLSRPHWNV